MNSRSNPTSGEALMRSPLLAKNTLLNLLGFGAPAVVALFAIPMIVDAIGTDRFGILTLAWVLIGYLSLLDMGMGRALTKLVAEKLGQGAIDEIPTMVWTALFAMVLLSIGIALVLGLLTDKITQEWLNVPMQLQEEARSAFLLLALMVPLVVISVGFRGILEAYQRFDLVNAVRLPLGVLSFAAPLLVIPFTVKLPAIIMTFLVVRLLAAVVQIYFCHRIVSGLLAGLAFRATIFRKLLRFGSWMTISNIVNPLLVYADRFFIGAFLSVSAVAFYATPAEAITHLALISAALMGVIFPAFSANYQTDRRRCALLLDRSLTYVFIVIFPIVFLLVAFAGELLAIWLNETFAGNSFRVCQLLSAGVLFTCMGQMPYALIQGAGRPDLTGRLHLFQLPMYIISLALVVKWGGINGAAFLWAFRALVDAVCMYLISQKLLGPDHLKSKGKALFLLVAFGILGLVAWIDSVHWRLLAASLFLLFFAWYGVRHLLKADEITFVRRMLRRGECRNNA